jgi:hypothetical protein
MKSLIVREGMPMPALFFILFLISSTTGFGAEISNVNIFNEYINSPDSNAEAPIDKNAVPKEVTNKEVTNSEVRKSPDKADTKRSLQGIPAKDQTCAIDSDCTAGVVDCVSWEPFNKKYLHELFKKSTSCPASIDPGFQPVTVCVAKVCKATEKTTDASWDDWLGER